MKRGYSYIDGVEELLQALKQNNYEMHAFTNYPIWHKLIEEKLNISKYLSWTFCSWMYGKRKPDPNFYLAVLEHLKVDAASCIFIDDRLKNVEAAEEVGINGLHFKNAELLCQDLLRLGVGTSVDGYVEELAFLVKDNLPCKHLVLSMEEAFINFLQDDASSDGILELEPMNSYNRLLLHRLADIFGFAHESVGEGDDRHLVLERCPETSIPSILVSDILWQCDEPQSLTTSRHLLTREEAPPEAVANVKLPSLGLSLEAREAAYLAARERIFSVDVEEVRESAKQKPRVVPVVARRMIAHALGQKVKACSQDVDTRDFEDHNGQPNEVSIQGKDKVEKNFRTANYQHTGSVPDQVVDECSKANSNENKYNASVVSERNVTDKPAQKRPTDVSIPGRTRNRVNKEYSKEEHLGAAKRMFAHALGLRSAKDGVLLKGNERKTRDSE
ncbi:Single-stranded nucleic acid binding R3H [Corchorus capsularis]|uniref:Single-stranded nucleic acid binding R3H n=1 Tax=Corchorus capsularis TaxID=210143 RepID=A0A1R3JDL9_COCAP|nr:Single-stranded nucleic acid binding R3H [Corchorus capsularis]